MERVVVSVRVRVEIRLRVSLKVKVKNKVGLRLEVIFYHTNVKARIKFSGRRKQFKIHMYTLAS